MNMVSRSLGSKLFLVTAAVSLVPLLLVAAIVYKTSSDALKYEIYNQLESVADSRAKHIADYIHADLEVISAIAKGNKLGAEFDKPEPSAQALEEVAVKDAARFPMFGEVFIMDSNGRIIATSDKAHLGLDRRDDEYFKGAISGKPYFKSIFKSPVTGKIGYVVSAPITRQGSDKIVGVAAARCDLAEFNKIVRDDKGMGRTGEAYIVNEDGLMITASRLGGDSVVLSQKVDNEGVRAALPGRQRGHRRI
jgi:C4-dicarboxylate-specific signal transduction histidine kinase